MPRIVTYDQQTQTPTGGLTAHAVGGSPIGEALQEVGKAGERLALGQMQEQFQTDAKSADVALTNRVNGLFYQGDGTYQQDPNSGTAPFMAALGQNAVNAAPAARAALQKAYDDVSGNLSPGARRMFDQVAPAKMAAWGGDLARHTFEQNKVAQDAVSVGRQGMNVEEFVRYAGVDDTRAQSALSSAQSEFVTRSERQGLGGEAITAGLNDLKHGAWEAAVKSTFNTDPHKANDLLLAHSGEMDPLAATTWQAKIKDEIDRTDAWEAAGKVASLIGSGPHTTVSTVAGATSEDDVAGIIAKAFPGARVTSQGRTAAENARIGGAANSWHVSDQGIDYVPPKGVSLATAKARIVADLQNRGVKIREAMVEHAGDAHSTGDHVHIAWDKATGGAPSVSVPRGADGLPDRASYMAAVKAQAGHDPQRQMMFEQMASARYSQLSADKNATEQAAVDAVQPYLRDTRVRSVAEIPAAVWAALPETTKTSVADHFSSGGQFAKADDVATITALHQAMVDDPQSFSRLDPTGYASKLTGGSYDWLLTQQDAARRGDAGFKKQQVESSRILGVAKPLLDSVGITEKGKPKDYAAFQGAMLRAAADWQTAHPGKDLADKDLHDMADGLLLRGSWTERGKGMLGGDKNSKGFAFNRPAGVPMAYDLDASTVARVKAVARASLHREPTALEVGTFYRRMHAQGML